MTYNFIFANLNAWTDYQCLKLCRSHLSLNNLPQRGLNSQTELVLLNKNCVENQHNVIFANSNFAIVLYYILKQ